MDGTCRAFVGIALPESYQRELAAIRDRLRPFAPGPMTWTRPGNWHLTLKFLGEVPARGPGGIEAVTAALKVWLAGVWTAESLEEAIAQRGKLAAGERFVTLTVASSISS